MLLLASVAGQAEERSPAGLLEVEAAAPPARPRIGLVLGGGGARGAEDGDGQV